MGENLKISNQFLSSMCLNHQMKRLAFISLVTAFSLFNTGLATAHQPVELGSKNTRADQGPILVDGTISFALRAEFTKANQERGFRASLKQGELLNFDFGKVDQKGKTFSMKGILSMNGHQKEIKTTATVKRNVTSLEVISIFEVNPEDFGIKIPSVVKNKIAKKVKISTFFELQ